MQLYEADGTIDRASNTLKKMVFRCVRRAARAGGDADARSFSPQQDVPAASSNVRHYRRPCGLNVNLSFGLEPPELELTILAVSGCCSPRSSEETAVRTFVNDTLRSCLSRITVYLSSLLVQVFRPAARSQHALPTTSPPLFFSPSDLCILVGRIKRVLGTY